MRRIGLHALAALLMLWTSLACSPSASTERVVALESEPAAAAPMDDVALCFGRVVDPQGRPVRAATVELRGLDVVCSGTVSDASGEFTLRGSLKRDRSYNEWLLIGRSCDGELAGDFVFSMDHLCTCGVSPASDPRGMDLGEIALKPTHTLEVRITGEKGAVQVDAHVARSVDIFVPQWEHAASAQANGDETVILRQLPAGPIQVSARGGSNGACKYVRVPDVTTVDLHLEPLQSCDVQVLDANTHAPIRDAELTLLMTASASGSRTPDWPMYGDDDDRLSNPVTIEWDEVEAVVTRSPLAVRTDALGKARLTGLIAGERYKCAVRAEGYHRQGPDASARVVTIKPSAGLRAIWLWPQERVTLRWKIPSTHGERPAHGTLLRLQHCDSLGDQLPRAAVVGRMENAELVIDEILEEDELHFVAVAPDGRRARLRHSPELSTPYAHYRRPATYEATSFMRPRTVRVTLRDTQGRPAKDICVHTGSEAVHRTARTDEFGTALLEDLFPEVLEVFALHEMHEPYSLNRSHGQDWSYEQKLGEFDLASCDAVAVEATFRPPFRGAATVRIDGRPALPNEFTCTPEPNWPRPEDGRLSFVFGWPESDAPVTINFSAPGLIPATATVTPSSDGSPVHFNLDLFTECALRVRVPRPAAVELTAERFETASGAWEEAAHSLGPPVAVTDEWLERRVGQLRPGRWRLVDKRSGMRSTEIELSAELREGSVEIDLPAPLEAEEAATGPNSELRVPIAPSELHSRWSVRVAAIPTGATVERLQWFDAPLIDGTARTTEIGAGEWTLWIDPGDGWAAQRIERVAVSEFGAQLRPLVFERGSSIFVRLQHAPGVVPPRVEIVAKQLDAPFLTRTHRSNFESTVEFPGLCAGRYRVYVSDVLSTNPGTPREVELNGGNAITIDWAP